VAQAINNKNVDYLLSSNLKQINLVEKEEKIEFE